MTGPTAEQALRALAVASVERVRTLGWGVKEFPRIPWDDHLSEAFDSARSAIARFLPDSSVLGGGTHEITLHYINELMNRLSEPAFDEQVFQLLWCDFTAELGDPTWVYRGVANVQHCAASGGPFELGDGITVRQRSVPDLSALGFRQHVLTRLWDASSGFPGASSYVIVVESRVDKSSGNEGLATGTGTEWTKAQRALSALRLLAHGDISVGRMWINRAARFDAGPQGFGVAGFSIPTLGSTYRLTESLASRVPDLYGKLRQLEEHGYSAAPGNLDLALRSFMATYDRWPSAGDTRVLDTITALEALLGSGGEIAFKLSFRTASILAADDAERVAIFDDMKAYYDLRSRLVHGAPLKDKHHALIADTERLRRFARELLRGFVHLAVSAEPSYGKRFFQEQLDSALQDQSERASLRRALDLG